MIRPAVIIILCCICLAVLWASPSYAFKFNIDSPKIILKINPGEKATGYITVDSYGYDKDLALNIYVEDLIYLPDGTNDFMPPGTTKWSLADWIDIEPRQFTLKANSSARVKYSIKVPPDAEGGRYGVVFFEVASPTTLEFQDAASKSVVRIGSIISATVIGAEVYAAELTGLMAHLEGDASLTMTCVIKNSGNVLIKPEGEFSIMDTEGVDIARKDMNPTKGGILPLTGRTFEAKLEASEIKLEKGKDYILQVTIDYGGAVLLGGQRHFNTDT